MGMLWLLRIRGRTWHVFTAPTLHCILSSELSYELWRYWQSLQLLFIPLNLRYAMFSPILPNLPPFSRYSSPAYMPHASLYNIDSFHQRFLYVWIYMKYFRVLWQRFTHSHQAIRDPSFSQLKKADIEWFKKCIGANNVVTDQDRLQSFNR
jgi:hypothetical protein